MKKNTLFSQANTRFAPTQFILILLTFIFATSLAQAAQPLSPEPPKNNPHPPITQKDKVRVNFAIKQVKEQLMKQDAKHKVIQDKYGLVTEIRHAHIIPWSFKKFKKNNNKADVSKKEKRMAISSDTKNMTAEPMPVPKLAKDEYMIHIYAKFSKFGGRWHHLDVIVTEDAKDKITFLRFFTMPIPLYNSKMPKGVICQLMFLTKELYHA